MNDKPTSLLLSLVGVAVLVGGFLLFNRSALDQSNIRWVMHNTETVRMMIEKYRNEHDGQYPMSLGDPEVLKHADDMDNFVADSNAVYQPPQQSVASLPVFQFKTKHGKSVLRKDGTVAWIKD